MQFHRFSRSSNTADYATQWRHHVDSSMHTRLTLLFQKIEHILNLTTDYDNNIIIHL